MSRRVPLIRKRDRLSNIGTAAIGAGAALIMAGSFLDWSGVPYSSLLDRRIAFLAGILSLIFGGLWLVRPSRLLVPATLLAGVVALDMAVVNYSDIQGHKYEYAAYPAARVGVGLYALLLGSGLLLAGAVSLLAAARKRNNRRQDH